VHLAFDGQDNQTRQHLPSQHDSGAMTAMQLMDIALQKLCPQFTSLAADMFCPGRTGW